MPLLALAAAGGTSGLSALYASLSGDLLRRPDGAAAAQVAASHAVRLAPWRAENHGRAGEASLAARALEPALEQSGRRLALAPGDSYAWLQAARVREQQGLYDSRLQAYYEMALSRAPNSRAVNFLIANNALRKWRLADTPLRDLWREGTRFILVTHGVPFLRHVVLQKQERSFCAFALPQLETLPHLSRWCDAAQVARSACAAAQLNPGQQHWCWSQGYLGLKPRAQ